MLMIKHLYKVPLFLSGNTPLKTPNSRFINEFERLYRKYYGFPIQVTWDGEFFRTAGIPYGFDLKRLRIMCTQLRNKLGLGARDPI